MDYYVDTAHYTTNFVQWANVAPYEPERRERSRAVSPRDFQTPVLAETTFSKASPGISPVTPNLGQQRAIKPIEDVTKFVNEIKSGEVKTLPVDSKNEIDRIAKQRVQLMAANYADAPMSTEILARLEILNHRLLERAPRVSIQQVQALEAAAAQVMNARQSREDRMKRLGIEA